MTSPTTPERFGIAGGAPLPILGGRTGTSAVGACLVDNTAARTTDDKMIPPPVQHMRAKRAGATVTEVKGSHSLYVSQPAAVAAFIEKAAQSLDSSK
jgi:hypothetical protein